jgi:serine/threonine protein kinase
MREIGALRILQDVQGVAQMRAWYVDGRFLYLLLDLGHGTLAQEIQSPAPFSRQIYLVMSLVHTLNEVHARGVVHGDLKPENIILMERFVTEEQCALVGCTTPYLVDWGLSCLKVREEPCIWYSGTYLYMAPAGADRTSFARDVWALGLVIHEILCGWDPTQTALRVATPSEREEYRAAAGTRTTHANGMALATILHRGTTPAWFAAGFWSTRHGPAMRCLVESCMRVNPQERITASGLLTLLRGFLAHVAGGWASTTP